MEAYSGDKQKVEISLLFMINAVKKNKNTDFSHCKM